MTTAPASVGAILAGGMARRMGGGDKGLHLVGDRPILTRLIDRLAPQCASLVLNANGDPARFAHLGLPVVPDTIADLPGPLAGVLAVLDWAADARPDIAWVVTAANDLPFLPRDFVARLHAARAEADLPLASAASGGRTHPVNGLWPVAIRHDLRSAIVAGQRKVGMWTAARGAAIAEWPSEPLDPFLNVNTPADLEAARRLDPS